MTIPKNPGIYKITCLGNGIIYIGSACNLARRRREHFSKFRRNVHETKRMQYCFNKYGEINIIYEVVEIVDDLENLLTREQYYIDLYKVCNRKIGFNTAPIAGNCRGVKHTDETKRKISECQKGKTISEAHKRQISLTTKGRIGKPTSEETKIKQRDIKLKNPTRYWLGRKHSPETRLKISQNQIGRKFSEVTLVKKSKTATFIDPLGNEITVIGLGRFARNNGLHPSAFCRLAKGEVAQHKGYKLKVNATDNEETDSIATD